MKSSTLPDILITTNEDVVMIKALLTVIRTMQTMASFGKLACEKDYEVSLAYLDKMVNALYQFNK